VQVEAAESRREGIGVVTADAGGTVAGDQLIVDLFGFVSRAGEDEEAIGMDFAEFFLAVTEVGGDGGCMRIKNPEKRSIVIAVQAEEVMRIFEAARQQSVELSV
jgi:hypothetical protein